jgi:hypothetical protein
MPYQASEMVELGMSQDPIERSLSARCSAELEHQHGVAVCDLLQGHAGQHEAWCDTCVEDGYDDALDRLQWDLDGENWLRARGCGDA